MYSYWLSWINYYHYYYYFYIKKINIKRIISEISQNREILSYLAKISSRLSVKFPRSKGFPTLIVKFPVQNYCNSSDGADTLIVPIFAKIRPSIDVFSREFLLGFDKSWKVFFRETKVSILVRAVVT